MSELRVTKHLTAKEYYTLISSDWIVKNGWASKPKGKSTRLTNRLWKGSSKAFDEQTRMLFLYQSGRKWRKLDDWFRCGVKCKGREDPHGWGRIPECNWPSKCFPGINQIYGPEIADWGKRLATMCYASFGFCVAKMKNPGLQWKAETCGNLTNPFRGVAEFLVEPHRRTGQYSEKNLDKKRLIPELQLIEELFAVFTPESTREEKVEYFRKCFSYGRIPIMQFALCVFSCADEVEAVLQEIRNSGSSCRCGRMRCPFNPGNHQWAHLDSTAAEYCGFDNLIISLEYNRSVNLPPHIV